MKNDHIQNGQLKLGHNIQASPIINISPITLQDRPQQTPSQKLQRLAAKKSLS